jgi:hypothetical protein
MGWPNAEPHAVAAQANRVRRQGVARIPRPMTFLAKDFKRGEKVSLISKRNADGGRPKHRVGAGLGGLLGEIRSTGPARLNLRCWPWPAGRLGR